jgi:hypothetical protein
MSNYSNCSKEKLSDGFKNHETLRSASLKQVRIEPEYPQAHPLETKRLLFEFAQSKDSIEIINTLIKRSRELEEANSKLKLVNSELEALNFTVSHDMRTPLSSICLYAQAVLRHCENNLDEQCKTYLTSIFNQTEYMHQLLNRMMEFSHASCKEIQKETVDLSSIAHNIAVNLRMNDPERSVEFNIMAEIEVNGDKCLLQEVLENILGNAWKYTGMKESSTIEFGVIEHDGRPAYFVRDNGIGFDMNQTEKLFGIFQRLHCKDAFSGYGIGLAAVKRIIHRHGGEVWAEGETGKGATFYFTL